MRCCASNINSTPLALCGDMIILWAALNEFEVKAILINVIKFGSVCARERAPRITNAEAVAVLWERILGGEH